MTNIHLYDLEVSGNCYKVRLFLALLGLDYQKTDVDFMAGAHKSPDMLARNPFGELPVLVDGDTVLRNSQAILVYLAIREDRIDWLPRGAAQMADIMQWMMVAESEIARGPNDARLHDKFGFEIDVEVARTKAGKITKILEAHLTERDWLCGDAPTIADIACFPYIALSHEGGVSLEPYPAVRAWIDRIKSLPDFVSMPAL